MTQHKSYKTIVLIPAYQPGQGLITSTQRLLKAGYEIVVVDDGSDTPFVDIFAKLDKRVQLVTHKQNKGKGAALKTGYKYIRNNFDNYVVVTADADGQHDVRDIEKVAQAYGEHPGALLLGSREFGQTHVPLKSRLGNTITRKVFALITHVKVNDTQTGLRAFDESLTDFMLDVEGERFEYEMNVLLACSRAGVEILELPIQTIYEAGNPTSHFNPITDSLAIYGQIAKFASSSLLSFVVDYLLFLTIMSLTKSWLLATSVLFANIVARIISASLNYTMNKRYVFHHEGSTVRSASSYAMLASGILVGNTLLLILLTNVFGVVAFVAKIVVEVVMFIVSYLVQKNLIFVTKCKEQSDDA